MAVEVHAACVYWYDGVEILYASLDAHKTTSWIRSQKKIKNTKPTLYQDKWGRRITLEHFPLDQEICFPD
jgi:hypothetical protein